jgi:hypothetical protein
VGAENCEILFFIDHGVAQSQHTMLLRDIRLCCSQLTATASYSHYIYESSMHLSVITEVVHSKDGCHDRWQAAMRCVCYPFYNRSLEAVNSNCFG